MSHNPSFSNQSHFNHCSLLLLHWCIPQPIISFFLQQVTMSRFLVGLLWTILLRGLISLVCGQQPSFIVKQCSPNGVLPYAWSSDSTHQLLLLAGSQARSSRKTILHAATLEGAVITQLPYASLTSFFWTGVCPQAQVTANLV